MPKVFKSVSPILIAIFFLFVTVIPTQALVLVEQTQGDSNSLNVWQVIHELGTNLEGPLRSFTFRVHTTLPRNQQFDFTALNSEIHDKTTNTEVVPFGCLPPGSPGDRLRGLTFSTEGVPAGFENVTIDFSCHNFSFIRGHRYLIKLSNANAAAFGGMRMQLASVAYGTSGQDFFTGGGLRYAFDNASCSPRSYVWNSQTASAGCNVWTTPKDDLYFILSDSIPEPTPTPIPSPTPTPVPLKIPLILIPGIGGSFNYGVLTDKGDSGWKWMITTDSGWRQFMDSLEKAGYQKDKDYFIAFYDWRKTNDWTDPDPGAALPAKKYLAESIDKAKAANPGVSKVNVVSHSMGGLVVRSYIESPNYRNDISKAFLIGSPNSGSSFAYYTWEGAEVPPSWDPLSKAVLSIFIKFLSANFNEEPYQMIHNHIKGIKDLLPIGYDYLINNNNPFNWTSMQEVNNFLKDTSNPQNTAGIFASKGVELFNVTGTSQNTWEKLQTENYTHPYLWKDGKPVGSAGTSDGDNTVTVSSSNLANTIGLTVAGKHANLPNAAASLIFNKLGIAYTQSSLAGAPDEVMVAWVASPVTLTVKDTQGNSVGQSLVDPTTDMKWVFVENPAGDYKIVLTGTGSGDYHVGVDYYTSTKTESVVREGTAISGVNLDYNLNFDPQNTQPLQLQPIDNIPPSTTTQLQGTAGSNAWFLSDVSASLSASDNEGGTGLKETKYSFDNSTWQTYTQSLTVSTEGINTIYYYSSDLVGNKEEVKKIDIQIDKTPPEANMVFNPDIKEIEITGKDDQSNIDKVAEENGLITITDKANHSIKLWIREKEKPRRDKISVESISYDNQPPIKPEENRLKVEFSWDKKDNILRELEQEVKIKGDIKMTAHYNQKKNQTEIRIKENGAEKQKVDKSGLILLKVITNDGKLEAIY